MMDIYTKILKSVFDGQKQLAILIDPDKFSLENTESFIKKINATVATHIFVGGSIVSDFKTDVLVKEIKKHTSLPVILFPGDITQISNHADGLLFLSLISGRNPDYLIGKHIASISKLKESNLEVIPTGYLLIESGKITAVQQVTRTEPLSRNDIQKIVDTAKAGELLGMRLIYLEAGSGAKQPVTNTIIAAVKKELKIPLIVGGGIRTKAQLNEAYRSGADLVVIGTVLETNELFFNDLKN